LTHKDESATAGMAVRAAKPLLARALSKQWVLASIILPVAAAYFAAWVLLGVALDDKGFTSFFLSKDFVVGAIVAVVLALLVSFVVIKRLRYEFRDAALALLLERKFPQQLGDRLITAVELSNLKEAEEIGYSPAMVEHTIHEAAATVDSLPLGEGFDYRRLVKQGVFAVLLIAGMFALVGGAIIGFDYAMTGNASAAGFGTLTDNAGIWFERNVLLQNTIWPRRAQLELVGFPENGDIKMGQGTTPPSLRVRALKWVVAREPRSEAINAYKE